MHEFTGTFTPQERDKPVVMVFDGWGYTPIEPISSAIKAADQKPAHEAAAGTVFKVVKGLGT